MDKNKLEKMLRYNKVSTEVLNIEDENNDYLYGLLNGIKWVCENFDNEPNGGIINDVINYIEFKIGA
jgi:hypothetical protein